jgi:hypothetical protein
MRNNWPLIGSQSWYLTCAGHVRSVIWWRSWISQPSSIKQGAKQKRPKIETEKLLPACPNDNEPSNTQGITSSLSLVSDLYTNKTIQHHICNKYKCLTSTAVSHPSTNAIQCRRPTPGIIHLSIDSCRSILRPFHLRTFPSPVLYSVPF